MAEHTPDVGKLVRQLATSPPFRLLEVARGYLVETQKVEAVNLLLVDYGQELLSPFGAYQGPPLGQEQVDQGEAGAAYRTQATRVGRVQLGWRTCVPVTLSGERFGVLDVRLAAEPSPGLVAELERVAMALAFALAVAGRATDEVELARRGRTLSLPAEIQWELLPRLVRGGRVKPVELDADLPLGVDPEALYRVQRLSLEPGDRLVLVSDGVLEAARRAERPMAPAGWRRCCRPARRWHPTKWRSGWSGK